MSSEPADTGAEPPVAEPSRRGKIYQMAKSGRATCLLTRTPVIRGRTKLDSNRFRKTVDPFITRAPRQRELAEFNICPVTCRKNPLNSQMMG